MATILGFWQDFRGGHWGTAGPEHAAANQFGGVNMIPTEDGGITPMCASRALTVSNARNGQVRGMFWAWGADGYLYFVQDGASGTTTTTSTATVFRTDPDVNNIPLSLTDVGGVVGPVTYEPDWVTVGDNLYTTIYGDKTYKITTAGPSLTKLTGTYGDAPAGRAMCLHGERLCVGGISDTRFGNHPNRIVFSGDDTGNDPTVTTAWETLNFFDLGADGTLITALYPTRDHLYVFLADQQVYLVTGIPGTSTVARRVNGFNKGSGAVTAFVAAHGAVDPAQTTVWSYDHTRRGPSRLSGMTLARVPNFGAPHANRQAADLYEGQMTMIGGPDELVMHGVALNRLAGDGVVDTDLELIRVNGSWAVAQTGVIGPRT